MRFMTWNIHSMVEGNSEHQLRFLEQLVLEKDIELLALQEVNQRDDAPLASEVLLAEAGTLEVESKVPLRADNFALQLCWRLRQQAEAWHFAWTAAHVGYAHLEEGIALLSRHSLTALRAVPLTEDMPIAQQAALPAHGMDDWRRRVALMGRLERTWVCTTHCGWWHDEKAPFAPQWARLEAALPAGEPAVVMGDLNNPAEIRGEGYDMLMEKGWQDAWACADTRDAGWTARAGIDGWHGARLQTMRLDYLLCRPARECSCCWTVAREDVSDHAGIWADIAL